MATATASPNGKLPEIQVGAKTYSELPYDPKDPNTEKLYVEKRVLSMLGGFLRKGSPVALTGGTGTAKTELARAVMNRVKADVIHQMEFGGITSGDQLDGMFILENGETKHLPSEHLKAVRAAAAGARVGYVQDELNRGSAFGINKLLRLYAKPYEYVSDIDGVLQVPRENLITVATLNVGFGFTGTTKVDAAVANRYRAIKLELPPAQILGRILQERFDGIDTDAVNAICKIYEASQNSDDSYQLNVRDAIGIAEGIQYSSVDLVEAIEILVGGSAALNGLPEEAVEGVITTAKSVYRGKGKSRGTSKTAST